MWDRLIAGRYYNFTNIRYGAPPTGHRRFRAPQPPQPSNKTYDGFEGLRCPQIIPPWWRALLKGLGDDIKYVGLLDIPQPESEDCLFLDVITPQSVFRNEDLVPVLVWIHGGSYILGDKASGYNPAGLLEQSGGKFIFVALNYRLGAFGFLAGENIDANAGLLDQRLALEWIQKHISKFGGDPERVTLYGESAGAGSVLHHISAYGGPTVAARSLLSSAIVQSPFLFTLPSPLAKSGLDDFLRAINASTIEEARALPADARALIDGNVAAGSTLGPVVEPMGLIPDLPYNLYTSGRFDRDGLLFSPKAVNTDEAYEAWLRESFPTMNASLLSYISNELYPARYDGSQPYQTPFDRLALTISDRSTTSSSYLVATAFENATYNYLFDMPPGLHTQDLLYSFNTAPSPIVNETIVKVFQRYITNFVLEGDPDGSNLTNLTGPAVPNIPKFDPYGPGNLVQYLGPNGVEVVKDPAANDLSRFWARLPVVLATG
ncbi:MAG: hypothetical protein M1817_002204 [Caeruleum heppii]|nr:MAG: hypothetical protein M1817_002204 [Caeruleum heppii]